MSRACLRFLRFGKSQFIYAPCSSNNKGDDNRSIYSSLFNVKPHHI